MTQQFTASEVRTESCKQGQLHRQQASDMLNAFADMLEARERAVPVAYAAGLEANMRGFLDVMAWSEGEFTIPLYTHPATSDAKRLAEALRAKIKEWRGAYHHVTEFDRGRRNGFLAACDSLERLLSTHPAQAQPLACNELPGMWSHSDFIGGDPDERSYAERTAQPPADQILDGVDIDFAESFERKEQPPAARVTDAMKRAFEHLASIGYPKNARGNYDKDGEWTFSDAVPRDVDAREVSAAFHALKTALAAQENPNG